MCAKTQAKPDSQKCRVSGTMAVMAEWTRHLGKSRNTVDFKRAGQYVPKARQVRKFRNSEPQEPWLVGQNEQETLANQKPIIFQETNFIGPVGGCIDNTS